MARLLLEKETENGVETQVIRNDLPDSVKSLDILYRNDYFATTLWCEEDIAGRLEELGYEGTQSQVNAVLNSGLLKNLGDCTDQDWEMIDYAIRQSISTPKDIYIAYLCYKGKEAPVFGYSKHAVLFMNLDEERIQEIDDSFFIDGTSVIPDTDEWVNAGMTGAGVRMILEKETQLAKELNGSVFVTEDMDKCLKWLSDKLEEIARQ